MRRLVLLACCIVLSVNYALAAIETIYLKNGSIIKGEIIEEIPGKSLKIQTRDGNIFVYTMDEVEKIAKETDGNYKNSDNRNNYRGFNLSIGSGYNIATKGGGGTFPIDLMVTKRFTQNFSFGLGSGVQIPTSEGSKVLIPLYADMKAYLPLTSTNITPFADIQLGYIFNTADDITIGSGKNRQTVEVPNYVMFSIMPGIRIPLSRKSDLDLSIGYQHYVATKGGGGSGAITFKAAWNLNLNRDPNSPQKAKVIIPTRDNGFEFGLGAAGITDWGCDLFLGYKWSHLWSFGLGLGYGLSSFDVKSPETKYYSESGANGDVVYTSEGYSTDDEREAIKIFVRGQYRFNDRKFSPMASVDFGYRINFGTYRNQFGPYYQINNDSGSNFRPSAGGLLVRPAIGMSWRTTNNSYLEARVGFDLTNGFSNVEKTIEKSGTVNRKRYMSVKYMQDGKNFSGLYVSIAWKHTFGLFSK